MDDIMVMDQIIKLLKQTLCFEGLSVKQVEEFVNLSFEKSYSKGEMIFHQGEISNFFHIVINWLVKVSICSFSGNKITYLLAGPGEPLNIIGVFTGAPRLISSISLQNTNILHTKRDDFISFIYKYPTVINNIMTILGNGTISRTGHD